MKTCGVPVLLVSLVLLALATIVEADCNSCVYNGECSTAYRGTPGRSCGVVAGKTCCCPQSAQCATTPYDCRCAAAPAPYRPNNGSTTTIIGTISSLIFFTCLAWCLCRCCCRNDDHEYVAQPQYIPVAQQTNQYGQPVYVNQQPVYAAQQPVYMAPPQPVVYQTYQSGYGVGTGAAVGAAAGLATGVAIGEAMHHHDGGYDGGYNNTTFAGDTGNNTFAGDSGDNGGGDFAGDF
ncbi:hypothetical protein H310_06650 [Aphanomyces invadans]|uniref:Uncharacterized protein n=1 Tax=Aphanomyces invadans TaxID=157072 RepID=A0A024U449_9STRA|nr:hypothetical protein H310_06650 [Aphanomyces invadans]ETW01014.1 hypothetical protein H310_06650 [Aphanomyces invadans]|eukprot:XP_008870012.1 hypothetical protein H310_06650 [Aphanomyces invadans]